MAGRAGAPMRVGRSGEAVMAGRAGAPIRVGRFGEAVMAGRAGAPIRVGRSGEAVMAGRAGASAIDSVILNGAVKSPIASLFCLSRMSFRGTYAASERESRCPEDSLIAT